MPMGGDSIAHLPGMAQGANVDLTLMRAYKTNGTAHANIKLIASSAAGPPWKLFRAEPADGRRRYTTSDRGSDQRVEVIQHAALNCLNHPAVIQSGGVSLPVWTRFALFEISNIWMETTGKSYWVVDRGTSGSSVPLGLWPVRPDRMIPVPDRDNYLKGYVYTSPDGREKIPLLPSDVIFNKYPDPEDPYGGCGPIRSVLTDVEAARYASEYNRNYFINSAEPGGVIQVDHELDDEEFNQLVDRWRDTHRGVARAHRIAVLEAGATWVPNGHSMKDMDFAGLRLVMADSIRESLAMHKIMTGITDDVNRANAQTGEEIFGAWHVMPRLNRWRDVLNSQFLPLFGPSGQGVEFDYIYSMPANREQDNAELQAKTQSFAALVGAGADPDDAAEVVGLPKMRMALTAASLPAVPPGWVLKQAPASPSGPPRPAVPAGTDAGEEAAESEGGGDASNRLRQMAAWNRLAGVR